ncbi:MAG: cytochrome oxidase putative small subunit CydP [Azonexus sp.]
MPARDNPESLTNRLRTGLGRHLVLVLVLKVLVLTGLWHAFIKPYRVKVDQDVMSARLARPSNQTTNKENSHDRFDGR